MTAQSLKAILEAPYWSKDVAVWVGSPETLSGLLSGYDRRDVDLLDLLPDDECLPSARDDRGELLRRALDAFLRSNQPASGERVVLVVHNVALLARYRAGVQPFYDWFAGDRRMTVLLVDRLRPVDLPGTVSTALKLDTDWLLDHFRSLLFKPEYVCLEVA